MTTKIEWTRGDDGQPGKTWNPTRGCSLVSPGCTNCYAMRQAARQRGGAYAGLTRSTEHGPIWTGKVRTVPELLDAPLHWRKPRRVFVDSMSDLFHEDVPDEFIDAVFGVMIRSPHHTFQILTKRADRMLAWAKQERTHTAISECICSLGVTFPDAFRRPFGGREAQEVARRGWPLPNVWLGVSVEDQARADERIPLLLQTPAAVRFLSVEPLLEAIKIGLYLGEALGPIRGREASRPAGRGIDWVIVGGESGPRARPCDLAWIRSIRDQCRAADVRLFVKQLGKNPREFPPTGIYGPGGMPLYLRDPKGGDPAEWPEDIRIREFPTLHLPGAGGDART